MGETILELKRDKERKGATYKSLAEAVLDESVEMTALNAEVTLKVKILDDITDTEELVTILRQQCEVATAAVQYTTDLARAIGGLLQMSGTWTQVMGL